MKLRTLTYRIIQGTLIFALALLLFAASASADSMAYVVSAGFTGNGEFGTVNLSSGAYQKIGPGEPNGYFGLAPGP